MAAGKTGSLLVLNAGSSSLKFAVYRQRGDGPSLAFRGQIAGIGQGEARLILNEGGEAQPSWPASSSFPDHASALTFLAQALAIGDRTADWRGIGHRVVHGGSDFLEPIPINDENLTRLERLIPLAPLHQPHNLAAIRAMARLAPALPQIACFDTAFHATQPEWATRIPLPQRFVDMGLKRYGFHGLSYEAILDRLPAYAGGLPKRLIVAHLGNGSSLAAIAAGRSIATSMGFSTLDGVIMGTRPGSLDPGILLYLLQSAGLDAAAIERVLYRESGLLALSETSADMRVLLADRGNPGAERAIALYAYRIRREIGSLAAALGGLDALVFTGGIGENAAPIRALICEGLGWLGITLDPAKNAAQGPDLAGKGAKVGLWAIPADEEGVIARHASRLI